MQAVMTDSTTSVKHHMLQLRHLVEAGHHSEVRTLLLQVAGVNNYRTAHTLASPHVQSSAWSSNGHEKHK